MSLPAENSKVQFGDFKDVFKEWPVRSIRRASEQLRQVRALLACFGQYCALSHAPRFIACGVCCSQEKVEREESKKKPGQQQLVGFDL